MEGGKEALRHRHGVEGRRGGRHGLGREEIREEKETRTGYFLKTTPKIYKFS